MANDKKKIMEIKGELGIDAAKLQTPQYLNYNKRNMMTAALKDIATLNLTEIRRPDNDWQRIDRIFNSGQPIYEKLAKLLVQAKWSKSYGCTYKIIVAAKNNNLINESLVIRDDFYDKRLKEVGKLPDCTLKEQILLSLNAMPEEYSGKGSLLRSVGAVYIPELNFEEIYSVLDYFSDTTSKKYDGFLTYNREGQTIWTPVKETPIEITYMEMNVLKEILREDYGEIKGFDRIGVFLRDAVRAYCKAAKERNRDAIFWQNKRNILDIFAENYTVDEGIVYPNHDIAYTMSNPARKIPLSEPILENMPEHIKDQLRPSGNAEAIVELAI